MQTLSGSAISVLRHHQTNFRIWDGAAIVLLN